MGTVLSYGNNAVNRNNGIYLNYFAAGMGISFTGNSQAVLIEKWTTAAASVVIATFAKAGHPGNDGPLFDALLLFPCRAWKPRKTH